MKVGLILAVIIYEIAVVAIVSIVLKAVEKKKAHTAAVSGDDKDFLLAGRNMGVITLAPTIALTVLGSAHITGVFEMSYGMGAIAIWFSLAHVLMVVVACFATGQWVRHFGITTVPELLKDMYGPGVALAISCTMTGQVWGVLVLECQGMGIVITALTGWPLQNSIIVGAIIGILWVVFAGMKELGAVNVVNATVMYIGLIIATVAVAFKMPGGNFNFIMDTFTGEESFMTNVFGNANLFISFAVGQIIAVTFCQGISQMLMQTMMSAKDEKTIRRSVWLAAPLNGLFGVFAVILGLAARAIPEYAAAGAKEAAMTMLVDLLPGWISAVLLAALLAAILSTFAMTSLTPSTIWVNDIYLGYINPKATPKQATNVTRILIVILAVCAMITSTALPTILDAIGWVFSWVIPVFFLVAFGLFWKRNSKVAIAALAVSWIANILWSFTGIQAAVAGAIGVTLPNAYVTCILTIVILVIGNLVSKNGEPGYYKIAEAKMREQQN